MLDDETLDGERAGQRAARARGLDAHVRNAPELSEHELQALLAVQQSVGDQRGRAEQQGHRDGQDDPAPAHQSTCVMLRCRRGFLSRSDSACAMSNPISSIGSRQRSPTPTEYSSGMLQSLKALPVS